MQSMALWSRILVWLVVSTCLATGESRAGEAPVTVFFVRHAEKADAPKQDPVLDTAGQQRARSLSHVLSSAGVTHLFASEYQRTQGTLGPLAEAGGLEIQVISARRPKEQIAALRQLAPGSVAVVAGHSNTIPHLVRELGGESGEIDETQYDRLFVAWLEPGSQAASASIELRYGAPSPR